MARLKPAAKGLIIAAVLGVAGVGLNTYLDSRPKQEMVQESAPVPEVQTAPPVVVHRAPEPEPVTKTEPKAPEPEVAQETTSNAGLDALLKGKK